MISFGCVLARMSSVALPAWLAAEPQHLAQVYAVASAQDIQLHIDNRLGEAPLGASAAVDAYALHEATAVMTQNSPPPADVKTIAVLFAGAYAAPSADGVFGMMFDRGFTTSDDENSYSGYTQHPREACAVFLDTIRKYRMDDAAFERETKFTTVHELGHVFNLQHDSAHCYLASSPVASPYGDEYFKFTEGQQKMLGSCSTSDAVRPGRAKFGDTGDHAAANRPRRELRDDDRGLELEVRLAAEAFWAFEPIELDVSLKVSDGVGRAFHVLNRLDPGYDEFRIWVEEPTGERRIYRAPRRYCAFSTRLRIAPDRPFRRDVSVFGEAGGFTFRRVGRHLVWAEFEVRPGRWLSSPMVEAEVRSAEDTNLYAAARSLLRRPDIMRLLYHRRLPRGAPVGRLEAFVSDSQEWSGVGRLEYGLGRALIAAGAARADEAGRAEMERGVGHLSRALNRDRLGLHQAAVAAKVVAAYGLA
jgi:hypothetical protein